jgi:anti-sigma regulatory factor (Ser/Thr protein kinase)
VILGESGYHPRMASLWQGPRPVSHTGDSRAQLTVSVPASAEASLALRQAIRSLEPWLGPTAAEDAELLVTELATNGVKHARAADGNRITLRAHLDQDALRIEVGDRGRHFDRVRTPHPLEPGGWGLQLVDGLADRWGVEREPSTTVWFELARDAAAALLQSSGSLRRLGRCPPSASLTP